MIYIRKLELVDTDGNSLLRLTNKKAVEGLTTALDFVKNKDGNKEMKDGFRKFFKSLDEEFKEYFSLK